jgi:O-antigen ligase
MSPSIATIIFATCIAGLFFLDRDKGVRTSKALWIPITWMLIVGSRDPSVWLNPNLQGNLLNRFTEGNALDAAAYGVLIAAGLLVLNFRSRRVAEILRANTPLLLFLAFCAVSVLWSDFPVTSLKRWIKGAGAFVMVLVVLTDLNPLVATKRLLSRTAFLILPLSVLFIKFYPSLGTEWDQNNRVLYYIGVTTQKNTLGLICMVCGLGSLWSFLGAYEDRAMRRRARHLMAHGAILVTAAWLLKTCDSMTSVSCLAIGGMVMFLSSRRWVARRPGNIHIMVAGAVTVAVFAAFIDSSGALLRLLGRNATLTGRTDIWRAVLSLHTNPLVGTGYESFWLGNRIQRVWEIIGYKGVAEAHNGYLEIYINLGWAGLAMLGVLMAGGYRNAVAALRHDARIGRLNIAFFTTGLTFSLTEAGFKMVSPLWIVLLLGIVAVPGLLHQAASEAAVELPWPASSQAAPMRILR